MPTPALPRAFAPFLPLAAALLPAALLAACGGGSDGAAPRAEPPLAGAAIGGPFTLESEDGRTVSWSDFDGRYRIVYFGYTYCPDICPVDMQKAMAGLREFEKAEPELGARIQPIFITVDPERDDRRALTQFTDSFHPRLLGLRGTPGQIAAVAKAFAVPYSRGEVMPNGGYLVNHASHVFLFGPKGQPIATLPVDRGAAAVAAELARWVH